MLSKNIIPFCSALPCAELDGLQNLLLSVRQGHHAVTGPHEAFATLSKNENLSTRERAIALGLANRRSELPQLEQEVRHKVYVESTLIHSSPERVNEFIWRIEAKDLSARFLSCLVVLAENMIDAQLYQKAASHYKTAKKITGVTVSTQARGGGGSQIDVELNSLLSSGIPVIAITDGDYGFENAPKSVISKRCDELVSANNGLGWHTLIPVREIENIVPHEVLLEVSDPKIGPEAYETVKQLALAVKNGLCPSCFCCLKSGTTLAQILKNENIDEQNYWLAVAQALKCQRPRSFTLCIEQVSCDKEVCNCVINTGFGKSVLSQVNTWLDERSTQESLKQFKNSQIWMDIGSRVFDAGLAFSAKKI